MRLPVLGFGAALAFLTPAAAAALGTPSSRVDAPAPRVVEIRVSGDAAALSRVRVTARELLSRLDVQANVRPSDEPATKGSQPAPLVVAYIDLRNVTAPSIEIEDGKTHQELTQRSLNDVASLETSVESVLHVLYLAVESTLQVGASPAAEATSVARPRPSEATRASSTTAPVPARTGVDIGPLLRLSSLGGTRIVPGGGVAVEPRVDFGRNHLGLLLSGTIHGASELSFARGAVDVRPMQARLVPTFDWAFSQEVSGAVGVGAGLDAFVVEPVLPPESGRTVVSDTAVDPILCGMVGARVPIAGRAFLSALVALDFDLRPTAFVARVGPMSESVLPLPRWRAGFTLALSFSAAGSRRFGTEAAANQ